jgi:hypothetical protein
MMRQMEIYSNFDQARYSLASSVINESIFLSHYLSKDAGYFCFFDGIIHGLSAHSDQQDFLRFFKFEYFSIILYLQFLKSISFQNLQGKTLMILSFTILVLNFCYYLNFLVNLNSKNHLFSKYHSMSYYHYFILMIVLMINLIFLIFENRLNFYY